MRSQSTNQMSREINEAWQKHLAVYPKARASSFINRWCKRNNMAMVQKDTGSGESRLWSGRERYVEIMALKKPFSPISNTLYNIYWWSRSNDWFCKI